MLAVSFSSTVGLIIYLLVVFSQLFNGWSISSDFDPRLLHFHLPFPWKQAWWILLLIESSCWWGWVYLLVL